MRKVSILTCSLFLCVSLLGQESKPILDPGDPNQPPEPTINFSQVWDQGLPPFFSVSISASGRAAYQSTPDTENKSGDPYEVRFTASSETRKKIFDLAQKLNYFQGSWDFTKGKIAFTGKKTLRWKNGTQSFETSYNWSSNVSIQELTSLFQDISGTVELGRKLAEKYRYDKLGVDAELKSLEAAAKDNQLAELQIIQPLLSKLAKDTSLMNISRRRAEFLLSKVPKDAQIAASQ